MGIPLPCSLLWFLSASPENHPPAKQLTAVALILSERSAFTAVGRKKTSRKKKNKRHVAHVDVGMEVKYGSCCMQGLCIEELHKSCLHPQG